MDLHRKDWHAQLEEARAQRRAYEMQRGDAIAIRERHMADLDNVTSLIMRLDAQIAGCCQAIDVLLDRAPS